MFTGVSHIDRSNLWYARRLSNTSGRVSIDPGGTPAPVSAVGDVQLFAQAARLFGSLAEDNHFQGERNVFNDVEVRRIHMTSDRTKKTNIESLDPTEATSTVRRVVPCRYEVDGAPAAGFLADEAPPEYTRASATGDRTLTLDYLSMLAHLWASVQDAHRRVDVLERALAEERRRSGTPPPPEAAAPPPPPSPDTPWWSPHQPEPWDAVDPG